MAVHSKAYSTSAPALEQDVEMPDISNQTLPGLEPTPNHGASSSKDPIESFSSAKPSNDDMEIDSDGVNPGQPQLRPTGNVHKGIERKSTKETIAAIASPQRPSSLKPTMVFLSIKKRWRRQLSTRLQHLDLALRELYL